MAASLRDLAEDDGTLEKATHDFVDALGDSINTVHPGLMRKYNLDADQINLSVSIALINMGMRMYSTALGASEEQTHSLVNSVQALTLSLAASLL